MFNRGFNWFMIALQIADAVSHLQQMKPGEEYDAPVIHAKSGTTNVAITIAVTQDAPKV